MVKRFQITMWVHHLLELAYGRESAFDVGKKLEIIRAAAQHEFPGSDMDAMLEEIESGYSSRVRS
jgi:hypothetical protein